MTTADSRAWLSRDYTPDQLEFLKALDAFKRQARCPHPGWPQVLAVAKALGYRRVAERESLPVFQSLLLRREQSKGWGDPKHERTGRPPWWAGK